MSKGAERRRLLASDIVDESEAENGFDAGSEETEA
jgi:hypothetical protein